ncbi:MAG TPA: alpha/beta hydrolase-fold protein [Niabella sp.]|nr:alpha/beta hydrolase-fold protein [Niabella sp.]HOZ95601.1 alpha/beta hydrolase-fold protein [Niabella sp.]HQW13841.1 alpha/beta hydrolase-fold protein [Niabella sp.]HQX19266.1 alpha/beta hydrolase-fold protein [Niabella sp.]HQX42109.1 alpha/beta hydrolase-fold protein [Niabella sp.]
MRQYFTFLLFFLAGTTIAQNRLTIVLDSLPNTLPGDSIFLAGSVNGWQPNQTKYLFQGKQLMMELPSGEIEFKITRGSWEKVETNADGGSIKNRMLTIKRDTVVHVTIKNWKDSFDKGKPKSTASGQVHILDSNFFMPALNRFRRIWIYLPEKYDADRHTYFPVLYMQDGQNLFDASTAFAGEWGVDEFLDSTRLPPSIVVGIDNGGSHRMTEYNPYDHAAFGKGEGKAYVEFLVKTLKPMIDKNFRTLKEAQHTVIAGSSMGGLISMYAVMTHPKVFGVAGVFSPAFWVAGDQFMKDLKAKAQNMKGRVYLYGGGKEGKQMVPDMLKADTLLKKYSKAEVKTKVKKTGQHNEAEWQMQFPFFYRWMMKKGKG